MKNTLKLILAAALLCACTEAVHLDSGDELILDAWTLSREGSREVYDVEVPSQFSVRLQLTATGIWKSYKMP